MSNMIWKKMAFFFHVIPYVAKKDVFLLRYTFFSFKERVLMRICSLDIVFTTPFSSAKCLCDSVSCLSISRVSISGGGGNKGNVKSVFIIKHSSVQ